MKKNILNITIVLSAILLSAPLVLPTSIFADENIAATNEEPSEPAGPESSESEPEPEPDPIPEEPSSSSSPKPKPSSSSSKPKPKPKPSSSSSKPKPKPSSSSKSKSDKDPESDVSDDDIRDDHSSDDSSDDDELSEDDEKKLEEADKKLEKERVRFQNNIDEFDRNRSSETARILIEDSKKLTKLIQKTSSNYEKSGSDLDKQINKNKLLTYVYLVAQIYYTPDSPNQAVNQTKSAVQTSFAAARLKKQIVNQIEKAEKKYDVDSNDSILVELGIDTEVQSSDLGTVQKNQSTASIVLINLLAAVAISVYLLYTNRKSE